MTCEYLLTISFSPSFLLQHTLGKMIMFSWHLLIKCEYKVHNGTNRGVEVVNFCFTDFYSIWLGYFHFQSHPAHSATSNQFLFCPLILSWYSFELPDFFHLEIQYHLLLLYMQALKLLCYKLTSYIPPSIHNNKWKRLLVTVVEYSSTFFIIFPISWNLSTLRFTDTSTWA